MRLPPELVADIALVAAERCQSRGAVLESVLRGARLEPRRAKLALDAETDACLAADCAETGQGQAERVASILRWYYMLDD